MEEPSEKNEFHFNQERARQDALRDLLAAAAGGQDIGEHVEQVKKMLTLGYDTEDNRNAMDRLQFTHAGKLNRQGLCVGDPPVLLSDILWMIEGMKMPSEVHADFPHLKKCDWEAAIRTIMLILTTYELLGSE